MLFNELYDASGSEGHLQKWRRNGDESLANEILSDVVKELANQLLASSRANGTLEEVTSAATSPRQPMEIVSTESSTPGDISQDNNLNPIEGDASIFPMFSCDLVKDDTCWYNREVGDSITLAINASRNNGERYIAQWTKVYKSREPGRNVKVKIDPEHCPWNVVIGSGGMELRLSPITDSDIDYNSFVAKVMSVAEGTASNALKAVKDLTFKINISQIDMGPVYSGEEVIINVENFATLPTKGLSFHWGLEEPNSDKVDSLPSNMKVSKSGKSVTIKELKKDQHGILSCAMYSSSSLFVAKRRFLLQIPKAEHRRSLTLALERRNAPIFETEEGERELVPKSKWRRELPGDGASRANHHRRSQFGETEKDIPLPLLFYSSDTKSRARRYFGDDTDDIFERDTFEDEDYDEEGTLFNTIPKEVHYVKPTMRLFTHETLERSLSEMAAEDVVYNCTSNFDCGPKASCVFQPTNEDAENEQGRCRCNPEYQGDGWRCYRPSGPRRRNKRIKRRVLPPLASQLRPANAVPQYPPAFAGQQNPYPELYPPQLRPAAANYQPVSAFAPQPETPAVLESPEEALAEGLSSFEDEESYLLAKCDVAEKCSPHASCVRASSMPAHCKCHPGYRGNGIFCWEIPDYVGPLSNPRETVLVPGLANSNDRPAVY